MKPAFHSTEYVNQVPTFNPVRNQWEILDSRCENMRCLFSSETEALFFKAVSLRQLQDREKWEADMVAKQEADAKARAEYLASFKGFLSADPMRAGRQLQTLEKRFNFRGAPATRKQIVETLVNEGRTITENGLESADGRFLAIGKTERAYAEHLISVSTLTPA